MTLTATPLYQTFRNGPDLRGLRVGTIVLPFFPALAICDQEGCYSLADDETGADMCVPCFKVGALDDVRCGDCEHDWNPQTLSWYPIELCGPCADEDAPWAAADIAWKERCGE